MFKLINSMLKLIVLVLGLIVLGMVLKDRYQNWRTGHSVPVYIREAESAVSNCVSSVQGKLADTAQSIPEPARILAEESLEKCDTVAKVIVKAVNKPEPSASRENYDRNLRQLERIQSSLNEY